MLTLLILLLGIVVFIIAAGLVMVVLGGLAALWPIVLAVLLDMVTIKLICKKKKKKD